MFKNYFKIAFRNLTRNKVYSFINIAGLTIGLTCAMLILLYVKDEVSFDRFQANGPHLYRVVQQSEDHGELQWFSNTGLMEGPKFAANVPGIRSFVRMQQNRFDIKQGAEVNDRSVMFVDPEFLTVFNFRVLDGDARTCLRQPRSIVLTKDEARRQFGTVAAVGRHVMVKERETFVAYTVTAVTENCPQNSTIQYNILAPITYTTADLEKQENWFAAFLNTFVLLDEHADLRTVEREMQRYYVKEASEAHRLENAKFGIVGHDEMPVYFLQPFFDIHLSTSLIAQNGLEHASDPVYTYILSGIALFVLLIASINFINLTVARSVRRAKEIGVRKAIGSDRRQLMLQFLGESFILCGIAFVMAILLTWLILPLFNELSDKKLELAYLLDVHLVLGYVGLFLVTGLLAGFYPALVLSGYSPVDTLYSRFTLKGKGWMQKSLVVLQFTLASLMIIGTLTIYSQFNYMVNTDLGYDDQNIVTTRKDNMSHEEAALFKNELLKYPGIEAVAPKNGGRWRTMARVDVDSSINFEWETVDESYFQTLKIPIVRGRNFAGDSADAVLVNETFVKEAGWKDPIGQQVVFNFRNNKTFHVVGVVKDYHYAGLTEKITPQLFTMDNSNPYGMFYIRIRPGMASNTLKQVQAKFREFFPFTPYGYVFKNDENRQGYESEARWKRIILFGAVLTIFISCIGLFGLSVLSAEKRTKEIGIRKVLGASVQHIATVLSMEFVKLVMIALLIAIPLAWMGADKWLENYPYRIKVGWSLFSLAGALVAGIAICTVSFQAVRAALRNPVKSLRSE